MLAKREKIRVGIDEAGRGPLAGPVIACALTEIKNPAYAPPSLKFRRASKASAGRQNSKFKIQNSKLKDSKKLSPLQREKIYKILKNSSEIKWGIGRISEKTIDKINIFEATKLAMMKAVKNLEKKIKKKSGFLLIDGNFGLNLKVPQRAIIKGDEKVFLIKLASIVAKVTRDDLMLKLHRKYPLYEFNRHKGYGTKLHLEMLKKHGPCQIHRKTFRPVANLESVAKK